MATQPISLILASSSEPWKTTYSSEDGQIIYKVNWDEHLTKPTRAIFERITHVGSSSSRNSISKDSVYSDYSDLSLLNKGASYSVTRFAELEYKWTGSCKVTFDGNTLPAKEFFKSDWTGLNQSFFGPDGKRYKWKVESTVPNTKAELFAKDSDSPTTPIAWLKKQHFGVFHDKRPASLEILPAGQNMVELIILSFVFVERAKFVIQTASTAAAAGS